MAQDFCMVTVYGGPFSIEGYGKVRRINSANICLTSDWPVGHTGGAAGVVCGLPVEV